MIRILTILFLLVAPKVWSATDWTADGDCVMAYLFEETSGNPSSECGSVTPSASNMTYSASGKFSTDAFHFDGSTSKIEHDSDITDVSSLNDISIVTWIYIDADDNTDMPIVSFTDDDSYQDIFKLAVDMNETSPQLEIFVRVNSESPSHMSAQVTSPTLSTATWYHVAYVSNASGNEFFIDGDTVTTNYTDGSSSTSTEFGDAYDPSNTDSLDVGFRDYTGGDDAWLDGKLDEFMIIGQKFTESEVEGIISSGIDGSQASSSSQVIIISQKKEWLNCKWHLNEYDGTNYTPDQCSDLIYS